MRNYFLTLLFLLPCLAFAADDNTITVSQEQPQFTITLAGNPTTGYGWFVNSYNSQLVKLLSSTYVQNKHPAGMVGVPGQFVFTFEAIPAAFVHTPQATPVTFIYARPWETGNTQVEEQRYTVSIVK